MKKRLDVQSLLEKSQKEDLVGFLKSRFAQNKNLANDFIIHFAYSFELDETEFGLITNRIRRMIPGRISSMTHRKARPIKGHIQNLMEQTRDCHSRQDFRQAYIIISHVITLLDQYIDQIPEKHGFKKLQNKSYQLLHDIYRDSPAPSLKKKMRKFLNDTIESGKAIPFHEKMNPYTMLLDWEEEPHDPSGTVLIQTLSNKNVQFPEYRDLWLAQQIQILVSHSLEGDLTAFIKSHYKERAIYETLSQYLPEQSLTSDLEKCLRNQYYVAQSKHIKNVIYQILRLRSSGKNWMAEVAIQEFFSSGDIVILDDLLSNGNLNKKELVNYLEEYSNTPHEIERFHLYTAYRHLDRIDLLKNQLMEETDVFEILPFLGIVYPGYRDDVRNKLSDLIETYLASHFGHPAIRYINNVMNEIIRLGHHGLHDYLIRKIRHDFGHRKHFQKMMKELVQ